MVYRDHHVWQLMLQVYSHCKRVVASWLVTSLWDFFSSYYDSCIHLFWKKFTTLNTLRNRRCVVGVFNCRLNYVRVCGRCFQLQTELCQLQGLLPCRRAHANADVRSCGDGGPMKRTFAPWFMYFIIHKSVMYDNFVFIISYTIENSEIGRASCRERVSTVV